MVPSGLSSAATMGSIVVFSLTATTTSKMGSIGLLMPITNQLGSPPTVLGPQFLSLTCAANLAVIHVNTGDDSVVSGLSELVQNFTINATVYDTGFTQRAIGWTRIKHNRQPVWAHVYCACLKST